MRTLTTGLILLFLSACGSASDTDPIGDAKNAVNGGIDMTTAAKEDVENAVVDRLDCSGMVREETRNLVTEALDGARLGDEFPVEATELARLIGAVAASTDTTALLAGNVGSIARLGHFPAAHANQWDTFTCDDTQSDACVDAITTDESGTYSSSVVCEQGEPTAVELSFADQCTLFVTENSGAVTLRRDDGAYLFDEFALGSVRQVDGALTATFEDATTDRLEVSEGDGLTIASNAGKSCESRLTLRRLVAERSEGLLDVDLDAERESDGKTFNLSTPEGPARFTEATGCACPDPGSIVDVRWTGFLKGQGDANLRLAYREVDDGERCADVAVEILSWPEQCEGESTDCGKATAEQLLGPLFSATCVPRL